MSLVTVILPVYNRKEWVARAIHSVLEQTYSNAELLVVDDGSNDGTRDVLRSFGPRLNILEQRHAGPYCARNLALRHARGELIAFIDSDDVWYPFRLERQLPLFRRPEVGLVFGDATLVQYREGYCRRLPHTAFDNVRPARGRATRHFARGNFAPLSSVLVRKRCFDDLGGFSLAAPLSADYAKWVEISMHAEVDYVPLTVIEYALHVGNFSKNLVDSLRSRITLFQEMLVRTRDEDKKTHLLQILFNLDLHLSIALLRSGEALPWPPTKRGASSLIRARWIVEFACNQIHTRVRRQIRGVSSGLASGHRASVVPVPLRSSS